MSGRQVALTGVKAVIGQTKTRLDGWSVTVHAPSRSDSEWERARPERSRARRKSPVPITTRRTAFVCAAGGNAEDCADCARGGRGYNFRRHAFKGVCAVMSGFKYLFSPLQVGPMLVRNRIVSTAHSTHYAETGMPGDRMVDYYAERARGGVGLIVLEAMSVHRSCFVIPMLRNWDDGAVPALKRVTGAVHEGGAKIVGQLWHAGRQSKSADEPVVAPSAVPCPITRETPKELEIGEIEALVGAYGAAARRCVQAGFDGVEIHAGHGYLVHQFLSPYSNRRRDSYGGSRENRERFLREVVESVAANVPADACLGLRVSGDDLVEGGLTQSEVIEMLRGLEKLGVFHYFSVTAGNYETLNAWIQPMYFPLGSIVYLAAGVKDAVDTPVLCIGRINDPVQAENILANHYADLVGMTRATLADPELPNKAREGRLDDIRHCIACNQGCWGRAMQDKPITCLVNPEAGRERRMRIVPAAKRKRVVVVGGGPAGMETARVAASRGHEVTLIERAEETGGQLNVAARAPGRQGFEDLVRWLRFQLAKLRVDVRLGAAATAETLAGLAPDAVVVATGAAPCVPELPGSRLEHVAECCEVLMGREVRGSRVLVVDCDGRMKGISVADLLLDRGKNVTLMSRESIPGIDVELNTFRTAYFRLYGKGLEVVPHTEPVSIGEGSVAARNVFTGREREIEGIDAVVFAGHARADDALYRELKGTGGFELHAVGDCLAPRDALKAMASAARLGRIL
ncbi:MAG: FAD-dependent oxidoreductase [bacterium]